MSGNNSSRRQGRSSSAARPRKDRLAVYLPEDLIERLRDAAYWTPGMTMSDIAEAGFVHMLERMERDRGGPFPPRTGRLKTGRPIR